MDKVFNFNIVKLIDLLQLESVKLYTKSLFTLNSKKYSLMFFILEVLSFHF